MCCYVNMLIRNLVAICADGEKDYELGTPCALHTPEIVLRAGYDCMIDIWAVGCMVSNLYIQCKL